MHIDRKNTTLDWNKHCDDCTECKISNFTCIEAWIGDGFCDDVNNKAQCKFDFGDCCNNKNPDYDIYCYNCTECEILKEEPCVYSWFGDNYCDDYNNNELCKFDGGDCCNNTDSEKHKYCDTCSECLVNDQTCVDSWNNDTFCDDYNNNELCKFDGGDCCKNREFVKKHQCKKSTDANKILFQIYNFGN